MEQQLRDTQVADYLHLIIKMLSRWAGQAWYNQWIHFEMPNSTILHQTSYRRQSHQTESGILVNWRSQTQQTNTRSQTRQNHQKP